jgi:hypothetical protein
LTRCPGILQSPLPNSLNSPSGVSNSDFSLDYDIHFHPLQKYQENQSTLEKNKTNKCTEQILLLTIDLNGDKIGEAVLAKESGREL